MDKTELLYMEALHRLQEWSLAVLGINTVLLVLVVLVYTFGNKEKVANSRRKGLWSVALIGASIIVGFNLIGTIPWSTQRIMVFMSAHHDIYSFPNYIGLPIWIIASSQHVLSLLGMISGYAFLCSLTKPAAKD